MIDQIPLLETRQLRRRHPDHQRWLLDDVSLRVRAGDRVAVTGPSGSGKTLLLRALALLDPLDSGTVLWEGRPVQHDRIPGFRRRAIYAHQRPTLVGDTVEAVLRGPFGLQVHREASFQRSRVVELLSQVGRGASFLTKSPGDLSGGESQIVALVRAMQLDPSLLLLDEPTAALDAGATAAIEGLLENWLTARPASRALVWVSHDAQQARRVADRLLQVKAGKVQEESTDAG